MPPKYESGAQKRKRKRNEIALIQSQVGDINKYFKSNNVNALNEDEVGANAKEIQYTYLDASREEQMSLIVRFVDDSANLPTVEEHWLEFLKVDDTTGLGLATELQKVLIKLDLDIDDIRGQGYDNGFNMSGKHKGVQKRLYPSSE
ncbi:uncharacterized protein LOC111394902 [Olea europaea var. sylvestris]|uniref:uncharacterized protein LOC111394902 n=1 Tax=Olea europaea var. sylvestris TaxID=158386 RepID=UPI000C1D7CD3|nr:uncharacterized protein LOC111394902 [Olea europaea var. sylvestris]